MSVRLDIEELCLIGFDFGPGEQRALSAGFVAELEWLVGQGGVPGSWTGSVAVLHAAPVSLKSSALPVDTGRTLARAVYGAEAR